VDAIGWLNPAGLEGLFFQHVPGGVGGFLLTALAAGIGVALLAWHRVTSAHASGEDAPGEDER